MNDLFELGLVCITPDAVKALQRAAGANFIRFAAELLLRHQQGDWGDLAPEDVAENERSVQLGLRILSAYNLPEGAGRLWVITEADRSLTTLLLPDEY